MIKLLTKRGGDGRRLLILGLDDRNLTKLKEDQPILVPGEELGLDVSIVVAHRPTLADLLTTLREMGIEVPDGFNPDALAPGERASVRSKS